MSGHYIRLSGIFITKVFSDAFEEVETGDICINEEGQRHFEYNGVTNPTIMDGIYCIYKYTNNEIVPCTKEEQVTLEQRFKDFESTLDAFIDQTAKDKGYDSRITATMYAGSENQYKEESQAFISWMALCYAYVYNTMNLIIAGTKELPTEAELLAELPRIVWP